MKKSRFKKSSDSNLPNPKIEFCLSIGDVTMCKWFGDEENWEFKSNDPMEFPYAP